MKMIGFQACLFSIFTLTGFPLATQLSCSLWFDGPFPSPRSCPLREQTPRASSGMCASAWTKGSVPGTLP